MRWGPSFEWPQYHWILLINMLEMNWMRALLCNVYMYRAEHSLGPETGKLDTVAVGWTTLATLLIIGLVVVLMPPPPNWSSWDNVVSIVELALRKSGPSLDGTCGIGTFIGPNRCGNACFLIISFSAFNWAISHSWSLTLQTEFQIYLKHKKNKWNIKYTGFNNRIWCLWVCFI